MKIFIMLGRSGDIINILPALEFEYKNYHYKPILVIAQQYHELLEGCKYIHPLVWHGDFTECNQALETIKKNFPDHEIINCSVYGKDLKVDRRSYSFLLDAWRFSQCPVPWGRLKPSFDKRDSKREDELLKHFDLDGKPLILTALSGTSSPFYRSKELVKNLTDQLPEFQVTDISNYKADRLFDLLALYEKAFCLIAIDSAPLHLAAAIPSLPVISLITDQPAWYRSSWRSNHILRMLYSQVEFGYKKIIEAASQGFQYDKSRIFYSTSIPEVMNKETSRRYNFSLKTRLDEAEHSDKWSFITYKDSDFSTNAKSIGDPHPLPFVKDMIEASFRQMNPDDILMIGNSDICFIPNLTAKIIDELKVNNRGAVFFHRYDFPFLERALINQADCLYGKWYPGSDAFAFTSDWYIRNKSLIPDIIFGRESWDCLFRNLIKRSKGEEIHEMIYHEKHQSFWEAKGNNNIPGNLHNRNLLNNFIRFHGGHLNDWKFQINQLRYR